MTVWSIADITRERERQENVFQELQHAIDYLDHAPAGFFSVNAAGDIVYLNATLANWLDHDLAQVGSGGAQAHRHRLRRRRRAADHDQRRARRSQDRSARHRSARRAAASPCRCGCSTRWRSAPTARPAPRARWCSTARATRQPIRSAPPKCASCASSSIRRWRSRPSTRPAASRAAMRALPPLFEGLLEGRRAHRSSRWWPSATARRWKRRSPRRRKARATSRRSRPRSTAPSERWASSSSPRSRRTSATTEAAIVYVLETTEQRTLENQINQQQKMESVGQLAGGIAHDFNNVLSAIMMATDFLLNAHKPTDPSFQDIMQIKQNANRAASAGAAAAGVLAPADAAAAGARPRRRAERSQHAAASG